MNESMRNPFLDYRVRDDRDTPRGNDDPREEDAPPDQEAPPLGDEARGVALGALERDEEAELRDGVRKGVDMERLLEELRLMLELRELEEAGVDRFDRPLDLNETRDDPTDDRGACVRVVGAMRERLCVAAVEHDGVSGARLRRVRFRLTPATLAIVIVREAEEIWPLARAARIVGFDRTPSFVEAVAVPAETPERRMTRRDVSWELRAAR